MISIIQLNIIRYLLQQASNVLDIKTMISDYTRLEDNIGDIGKGPRKLPFANQEGTSGDGECETMTIYLKLRFEVTL